MVGRKITPAGKDTSAFSTDYDYTFEIFTRGFLKMAMKEGAQMMDETTYIGAISFEGNLSRVIQDFGGEIHDEFDNITVNYFILIWKSTNKQIADTLKKFINHSLS